MREIKFRAWNKKLRFMDSAWLIDWEHELVCHSKHNQSDLKDCVLLQYTGLKDKNGVEVYEGDIIRDVDCLSLWKVFYGDGAFHVRGGEYNLSGHLNEWAPDHCEVIGNIYENPELLEATK